MWAILGNPRESGVPGKTGLYDHSVILDTELWLSPYFEVLIRGADAPLWTISSRQLIEDLSDATEFLGLHALKPCRYSLRHGGASDDLLEGRRSKAEVRSRGGWRTEESLRRYGKSARALTELGKMRKATLDYGVAVLANLPGIFSGEVKLRPPVKGP